MKRCFNTNEAMDYLGVRRKFFTQRLVPMLEGKGVRAGTSVVYEKVDLDDAWERYKLAAGSERTSSDRGTQIWDVQNKPASTRSRMAATRSMRTASGTAFADVVSIATHRRTST